MPFPGFPTIYIADGTEKNQFPVKNKCTSSEANMPGVFHAISRHFM
jgi:hypothetical protein